MSEVIKEANDDSVSKVESEISALTNVSEVFEKLNSVLGDYRLKTGESSYDMRKRLEVRLMSTYASVIGNKLGDMGITIKLEGLNLVLYNVDTGVEKGKIILNEGEKQFFTTL